MAFAVWNDADRRRQWLLTLIAVVAVQALYWIALLPVFMPKGAPPDQLTLFDSAHAELASPDWKDVAAARFEPIDLPWEFCCRQGYHAVRTHFRLAEVPGEGLAIVPVAGSDNLTVRVNGSLLFGKGRMHLPDITYDGNYRGVMRIPSGLLRQGTNEVVLTLVRGPGALPFFVKNVSVGPYAAITAHYHRRMFMTNEYAIISISLGLMVAALAFFGWLRSDWSPYLGWLTVLAVCWTLALIYFEVTDPPLRGNWRPSFMLVLLAIRPVVWLNLVNQWSGDAIRWLGRASLAALTLCIALVLTILWSEMDDALGTAYRSVSLFTALLSVATTLVLLRKIPGLRPDRRWELAIYVLVCTLMIYDGVLVVFDLNPQMLMNSAVPILLAALVIAFLARNVRLFQSAEQINALLQTQLDERTADLERSHAREKELVRAQAHQSERQRIMRDMHDGLGSQLMSMLLAARRGVAKPAVVAEGLQSVIDEMRLLIDSMDSVGESLGSAFALFRDRMEDRVRAAGLELEWHDTSGGRAPDLGPREVLQVFRIMQEAVTNALKHSGGSRLSVTIAPSPEPGRSLRIVMADDGGGLGKANPRGRGLESMAARAAAMGASLDVQSRAQGVAVVLDLPDRSARAMP